MRGLAIVLACGLVCGGGVARGADEMVPKAADGRPLNLDFETGTLADWTATGRAFEGQPVSGDTVAQRRADARSGHQGQWWVGSFERGGDEPKGLLESAPLLVSAPYASFYMAGGGWPETRVELVEKSGGKVIFHVSGDNTEEMRPVVVDLRRWQGQELVIRLVDRSTGGWGHINFDHFRLHAERPQFANEKPVLPLDELAHAGLDPEAAAAAMSVPEGFSVKLFASEPTISQPVAMCLDDRGRVWLAEAHGYPHRQPEGKGRDRIVILTDEDGDGRCDKHQVFAEGLNLVSGLEVGFGGVWVGAAPQLLFFADANRDDRPDGPPTVLLDGWGYQDTHETLNAFTWGPDGWLYGCHGVFTHSLVGRPGTPKAQRKPLNAGIWRFHPQRHEFEVFAEGTSNPWGVDFDAQGQSFCTACVIPHLFHVIQGARYQRQAGQHFNRYTYDDLKTIADHVHWVGDAGPHAGNSRSDAAGGGHAHAGAMIYLGDAWPEEFRGRLYMHNIHGARVNCDVLEAEGSGFVGRHGPDFLRANDSWSQMLSLHTGPDGQVYVIDWYDANQCHRPDPSVHDRSNGRVFKVCYGDRKTAATDLTSLSDAELVSLQTHPNQWQVRHARRILQERGPNPAVHDALTKLWRSEQPAAVLLQALWALHATQGLSETLLLEGLKHQAEYVRAWSVQLACEQGMPESTLRQRLESLAASDPSPIVRRYLASAAQRWPVGERKPLLAAMLAHGEDAADRNLPLMYWWAAEPLAADDPRGALALALGGKVPLVLEYLVRRVAEGGGDGALENLVAALVAESDEARQTLILQGLEQATRGQRQVEQPASWGQAWQRLQSSTPAIQSLALKLAVTFGDEAAVERLRAQVAAIERSAADRQAALEVLLAARDAQLPPLLRTLLNDPALRGPALRGLAAYDDPEVPAAVLAVYPRLSAGEKHDALYALASRSAYASVLLDAVADGRVTTVEVAADIVRQLRNLKDASLDPKITAIWGVARESAADRAALIARYRRLLNDAEAKSGDPWHGREVFVRTCQQCHKLFGTGGDVGPELTGSNRGQLDYVLSNVLDPSAVMAREYLPTIVALKDGRVVTGIVKRETDSVLELATANERVLISTGDIEERQLGERSMMPDDLWKPLSDEDVRGLVSYLASAAQTPWLAPPEKTYDLLTADNSAGWQGDFSMVQQNEGGWSVTAAPGRPWRLVSQLAVEDFRLSCRVRLSSPAVNSAVVVRAMNQEDRLAEGIRIGLLRGGIEALADGDDGPQAAGDSQDGDDGGLWRRLEIEAVGETIRCRVEGKPVAEVKLPSGPWRGVFALELAAGAKPADAGGSGGSDSNATLEISELRLETLRQSTNGK